jgi:hypothetical protein
MKISSIVKTPLKLLMLALAIGTAIAYAGGGNASVGSFFGAVKKTLHSSAQGFVAKVEDVKNGGALFSFGSQKGYFATFSDAIANHPMVMWGGGGILLLGFCYLLYPAGTPILFKGLFFGTTGYHLP